MAGFSAQFRYPPHSRSHVGLLFVSNLPRADMACSFDHIIGAPEEWQRGGEDEDLGSFDAPSSATKPKFFCLTIAPTSATSREIQNTELRPRPTAAGVF